MKSSAPLLIIPKTGEENPEDIPTEDEEDLYQDEHHMGNGGNNHEEEDSGCSRASSPFNNIHHPSSGGKRLSSPSQNFMSGSSMGMLSSLPKEFVLQPESRIANDEEASHGPVLRIHARVNIKQQQRFGPYQAKIRKDPSESSFRKGKKRFWYLLLFFESSS